MEFKQVTDEPDLLSELTGRKIWVNEDRTCTIVLYNQTAKFAGHPLEPGEKGQLTIQIHMGSRQHEGSHNVALCKDDGVAAFMIQEIMAIAAKHSCKGKALEAKSQVFQLIAAQPFVATLPAFQAYKEGRGNGCGV